jgi:hypothetical protein
MVFHRHATLAFNNHPFYVQRKPSYSLTPTPPTPQLPSLPLPSFVIVIIIITAITATTTHHNQQ